MASVVIYSHSLSYKVSISVKPLRFLKEKGVENSDILAMNDIVEKEGSDLQALRSKAAFQGGLDKTIQEAEKKLNDLETRKL